MEGATGERRKEKRVDQIKRKRDSSVMNWALTVLMGTLLWSTSCSAAPMECHFNSRGEIPSSNVLSGHEIWTIYLSEFISDCHVLFQLCVCSRGGSTRWGKPGWTTPACSAPVCTLSGSVAARREYTNNLCGLVSRWPQLLYVFRLFTLEKYTLSRSKFYLFCNVPISSYI